MMKKLLALSTVYSLLNLAPLQGQCYTYYTQPTCEAAGCIWDANTNVCGDGGGGNTSGLFEIYMYDNYFSPVDQYINVGDTVKWINNGSNTHTATSNDGSFNSYDISSGQSFTHIFSTEGNFSYYCTYHSNMTGTINVSSGGGTDYIDISNPTDDSVWDAGSSYSITWNTNLDSWEYVSLTLYKYNSYHYNIVPSTENDGNYTFYVPDTVTTSDHFQIYIEHSNSGTSDYSDEFTINGSGGGSNLCESQIEYVLDGDGLNYIQWSLPIDDGICDDTGHTGYKIYREDNPGNPNVFDQTNAVGAWETDLTNGTTYCYYVSAVYGADEAPASQSVCGTPTPTPSVDVSGFISYPDNAINFPSGGLNVAVFKNPSSWPPAASDIPIATDNISPVDFSSSVSYTVEVMDPDYPDWNDTYYYIAAKLDEDSDGNNDAGGMYSNDAFTDTDNIEANSYDFSLSAEGGSQATELVNGDTVSGISISSQEELMYYLDVPTGQDSVRFEIFGGTGDADLYVRHGSYPVANDTDWDCRPYVGGNNEECVLTATEGTWYVMIKAYVAVTGLSLVGEYGTMGGGATEMIEFTVTSNESLSGGETRVGLIKPGDDPNYWSNRSWDWIFGAYTYPGSHPTSVWDNAITDDNGYHLMIFYDQNNDWQLDDATEAYVISPAFDIQGSYGNAGTLDMVYSGSNGPLTISVTSPSTGDNWSTGTGESIEWISTTSDGNGYNVDIELWQNNAYDSDIVQNYASGSTGGSFWWSIPSFVTPSTNYQIKVQHTASAVEGTSSVFAISTGGGGTDEYSLDFGVSGSAEVNNFGFTSGEITVEMFFKLHSTDQEYEWFWIGDHSASTQVVRFGYGSSNIEFELEGIGQLNAGVTPTPNDWIHVAAVYNGNEMRIFVNGTQQQSSSPGGTFTGFTNQQMEVGWSMNGLGDVIRVSDIARYDGNNFDPWTQNYSPDASSVLLWHCNENTGSVLNDDSGNNYTGSFTTGTPIWSSDTPFGGGGTGGRIGGGVSLNENVGNGQVNIGVWLPGSNTMNAPDISIPSWGENSPFSNIGFDVQDDQITPGCCYTVGGFFDTNNNWNWDDGEPQGMVENITIDASGEYFGVDLVLSTGGGNAGKVSGLLTFDMNKIAGGDAIVGLFWPGENSENIADWGNNGDMVNLGGMSSGNSMNYEFNSSAIYDNSSDSYSVAAFIDYDGDETPGELEPYITTSDIMVSAGIGDVPETHVTYNNAGNLYTETSDLFITAITGEVVDLYFGILNDGSGPALIDNVTTDNSEFSVQWYPIGIGAGGNDFIHCQLDFPNVDNITGNISIALRNNGNGDVTIPYDIDVYDDADASITTDTTTVSSDGTYDLDAANTSFDFSGVSGSGGTITATLVDGMYPSDDSTGMADRYWEITADFDFNSATVCFDLTQLDAAGMLDGITDFNSLVIYYRPSYSQEDWIQISGGDMTYNESEGTVCADVGSFSQWTVGGGDNFLPTYTVSTDLDQMSGSEGQGVAVTATISGISSQYITDVKVVHFKPGDSGWGTTTLNDPSGAMVYDGEIPDGEITAAGLAATVVVTDSWNRVSTSDTVNIPISFGELTLGSTSANTYRMISVPGNLDDKSINGVVGDDLGAYDNTVYRVFRYDPQGATYNENSGQFTPTTAFWVITASGQTLKAGSGVSTPLVNVPTVTLQPGWNMVATPYAADTYLSSFEIQSGNVEDKVYRYTGNGYTQTTQLQQGSGYWLFVNETSQIKVKYPRPGISKPVARTAAEISLDFAANIKAYIGNARDDENQFGLSINASNEWDELDSREPPVIGEYISLAFDNRNWTQNNGLYNTDIQPTGNAVNEWPLVVTTNKYGVVNLDFEWMTLLEPSWTVHLVDLDLGLVHDVSVNPNYSYASTGSEKERSFVIVAGDEDDVETEIGKYGLIPDSYALGQNIPNPFNPVTSIPIVLGEDAYVSLSVYNIRGEEVSRILDHQSMTKGHHNPFWIGTDSRGLKVPTGVYLYRLEAVDSFGQMLYQNTRKMIMVK